MSGAPPSLACTRGCRAGLAVCDADQLGAACVKALVGEVEEEHDGLAFLLVDHLLHAGQRRRERHLVGPFKRQLEPGDGVLRLGHRVPFSHVNAPPTGVLG